MIVGDLPPVNSDRIDGNDCTTPFPRTIDDTYICGRDEEIDGVGSILGSAGVTWLRPRDGTAISGNMRFDTADVANLISAGTWESVILHEMGHVL